MNDMSAVIVPKSDQINADDLIAGPRTITITDVTIRPGTEQPVSIHFEGDNGKPWKTCKSMNRVLVTAWGPDAKAYVGRSVTIYRDPNVKWGGMAVGGIRISHLSHIERDMHMALTETKGKRSPFLVKVLQVPAGVESKPRQTADEWAADHLGFVNGAADLDRLAAVQNAGKKAMDKLVTSNPKLHAKIVAAYAARLDQLTDEDDPFAQGRSDDQHGDQHDGTANTSTEIADKLIERVKGASAEDLAAIEAEYQTAGREMLDVPDQDRVETAIGERRASLKGGSK